MTFLEEYMLEHPGELERDICKLNCPKQEFFNDCGGIYVPDVCLKCWNREIPEEKSEPKKWICEDCHYCHDDDGIAVCTQGDTIMDCEDVFHCGVYKKKQETTPEATIPNALRESVGMPRIKDSGNRREFETGAVRDIQEGKGRCDLLPLYVVYKYCMEMADDNMFKFQHIMFLHINNFIESGECRYLYRALANAISIFKDDHYTMILEVAKHFEEGAKKYGEYNWQKGIPTRCYIDSAVRHYLKYLRGDRDEPHDRAFCWNILCCIWTCIHKPELNDYRKENKEDKS